MKNYLHLSLALFLSVTISAQTYLDIDVHEGKDTIEANIDNPNFTILDVRTASEYFPEHIEGAIYRDFFADDFELQLDSLSKSRVYLIYCRSGNRSGQSLEIMKNLGFETVYNMLGGMNSWNGANYPVTDVIPPFVDIYANSTHVIEQDLVQMSVFPNPTAHTLEVTFLKSQNSEVSYKIISQSGAEVLNGHLWNSSSIDISTLDNGFYNIIIAKDSVFINSFRVLKQN